MPKEQTKSPFRRDLPKLIVISVLYSLVVIVSQWPTFSQTKSLSDYEKIYSQSQYVKGNAATIIMGDGDIYTYAGTRYLQGVDPLTIEFPSPPLIKYLFGISYLLTGRPNWVLIPFIFIAICSYWYLATLTITIRWGQWLALILFLVFPTIYNSIPQTMLDFPMTALLLLLTAVYYRLILKAAVSGAVFFGICAGLVMLSKYPFPLLFLYILFLFCSLLYFKVRPHLLFVSIITLISVYLLGYLGFFINHHNLLDFVRFEWWRLRWFMGKIDSPKGMIWQTIFLGKYPKWWDQSGGYVYLSHWNILMPAVVLAYFASFIAPLKQQFGPLLPYKIWILLSLTAYSLGVAEDRFLIPLIPGFALFGAQFIVNKLTKS